MKPTLRPKQLDAINKVRQAFGQARSVVLVAPCGFGKTVVMAEIARLCGGTSSRVLVIAHRIELIHQTAAKLAACGVSCGIISASSGVSESPGERVQVASIQTLIARGTLPPADLIIVDECHTALSNGYRTVLEHYKASLILGLSATPERADLIGLGEIFQRLVTVTTTNELISNGYLVPCSVVAPSGPLGPGEIATTPYKAWAQHAPGRSTIVFSPNLNAAAQHMAEFTAAGVVACLVEGGTDKTERKETLEAFARGDVKVIVNVNCLIDGTDLPITSCVILARSCTPGGLIQMTGRGLRLHPSKTDCVLIDLRGITHIHGHPTEDRVYSLEGRGIRRAVNDINYLACRVCGSPLDAGEPCGDCGTGPLAMQPPKVVNAALVKYAFVKRMDDDALTKMLSNMIKKRKNPRQAAVVFQRMTGHYPTRMMMERAIRL